MGCTVQPCMCRGLLHAQHGKRRCATETLTNMQQEQCMQQRKKKKRGAGVTWQSALIFSYKSGTRFVVPSQLLIYFLDSTTIAFEKLEPKLNCLGGGGKLMIMGEAVAPKQTLRLFGELCQKLPQTCQYHAYDFSLKKILLVDFESP